jgi:hypothetical protein
MYTGSVKLRLLALMLALAVTATPVIGSVCQLDCQQPKPVSTRCHDAAVPDDGTTFRDAPHRCDRDHVGGSAALLTGVIGRNVVTGAFAAVPSPLIRVLKAEPHAATREGNHAPPGPPGSTSAFTVLRI